MLSLSALSTTAVQSFGYLGVFVLMTLESALIPIPSEITMPFAGFLASKGLLNVPLVILTGTFGNLVGAVISYFVGTFLNEHAARALIKRFGKYVHIFQKDYDRTIRWFDRYGSETIFISRLLPGVRTFISLPAGIFRENMWKFGIYTFLGSLIWSAALTYLGVYLGDKWQSLGSPFRTFQYAIVILILILVGWFVYVRVKTAKHH